MLRDERPEMDGEEPATLLLIEDNEDDVEIVRRTLGRSGAGARLRVVRDATQAMQALRASAREEPGGAIVVLLDLLLPVVDGIDVLRAIREDQSLRDTPIVVLTGSSDIDLLRRCMALGTNMYLLKPLNVADVMNILLGVRRYWGPGGQPRRLPARQSEPAMQRSGA